MLQPIPRNPPLRTFREHKGAIWTVAVFPDKQRMVTGSWDKTLRLWNLETGKMWKKMEGHRADVNALAVSRDGRLIASGDENGELIAWDGVTESLITQPIKAHSKHISCLDFSPDGTVLATGSWDNTTTLWSTETWEPQGSPIECSVRVRCVRYSPSGEHLAIATNKNIEIHDLESQEVVRLKGNKVWTFSLAWTPDGTRLLSGGDVKDPTIREWNTSTTKQVGVPWTGHTDYVYTIAIHDTHVASASADRSVRLWRLSDHQSIATFRHSGWVGCVTFSIDGKHILSGGGDKMISEWKVPEDTGPEEASASKILPARDSCIVGDPAIAEDLFKRETFKLRSASEAQNRELRGQYIGFSEAEVAIRKVISDQLEAAPIRLLNTATGLLCPREVQIRALEASEEYKKLYVLWDVEHPDLRMGYITDAVAMYFRCVMLSHRWEAMEPLLLDIQDKVVYALKAAGGLVKLQSFCKMARDAGYHWAWVDTCCIDQRNTVEVQESLNSMFTWYRNSALTAVYLSDVPPSSKPGAMAKSVWNTRGWTVPEFLAPKVIRFYQQDWSLYLGDDSPNHKESVNIIDELERATGIAARTLIAFQPGMRDAREKLQWVSNRVTTKQEDIAYSLFGIFSIEIPIFYGEKKQKALGRLLQEIVARSGDITALDWVGQSSEFNSCLPADISSYALPAQPLIPSPLSEDKIRTTVSSLQHVVDVDLASKFYSKLERLKAPRFASNRLHLPCIAFHVTEVRRPARETPFTYEVKADGLRDLLITTEETLLQFTPERPTRQTLLLVRSWDRRLLELPEFAEEGDSDSYSRALRLIVHLGQPFGAFLLARQRVGEYKRIASDHDIIAQVKDAASVHNMLDGVETLEIL